MGKLRSIDRKTSYRNTVWAELVSASVIAIGFMMCALQMFGFSYGLDNAFSGGIGGGMINAWMLLGIEITSYCLALKAPRTAADYS